MVVREKGKRMDREFIKVTRAFTMGDPRPLAKWVLTHDMTSEQKEFVAKVICGEVKKIDGRKFKPLTEAIDRDYERLKFIDFTFRELLSETNPVVSTDVAKAKILADKYGYQDADSVRRRFSRYKNKIGGLVVVKKRVVVVD